MKRKATLHFNFRLLQSNPDSIKILNKFREEIDNSVMELFDGKTISDPIMQYQHLLENKKMFILLSMKIEIGIDDLRPFIKLVSNKAESIKDLYLHAEIEYEYTHNHIEV